jgi:hypothetical protein
VRVTFRDLVAPPAPASATALVETQDRAPGLGCLSKHPIWPAIVFTGRKGSDTKTSPIPVIGTIRLVSDPMPRPRTSTGR